MLTDIFQRTEPLPQFGKCVHKRIGTNHRSPDIRMFVQHLQRIGELLVERTGRYVAPLVEIFLRFLLLRP